MFLKAYVTLGFSPFSVSFDFTIVDVTLLDFTAQPDCDPPPPEMGGLTSDGKTLVVYAASLDGPRGAPYVDQEKETIKITSLHDYPEGSDPTFEGVSVAMLGIRREYRNDNIERVIVDGHDYTGKMNVIFQGDGEEQGNDSGDVPPATAQFELDAIVFGGSNEDKIKTGIGNSWVDGGGGDDIIVTSDRTVLDPDNPTPTYLKPSAKAWVAGGSGNDNITVGNGDDVVAGDSSISYSTTSLSLRELINDDRTGRRPHQRRRRRGRRLPDACPTGPPSAHPAAPRAPTGTTSSTWAWATARPTATAAGTPSPSRPMPRIWPRSTRPQEALFTSPGALLIGGTGDDSFAGGNGDDEIWTAGTKGGLDADPDADGGADDGHTNTVDTGTGNDVVYGSTGVDNVAGHSLPDESDDIRGGAGDDVLVGGTGTDTVFGGPGDDYVIAEPSGVEDLGYGDGYGPAKKVTHQDLPTDVEPSSKVLVGGTGNDHIIGGDGGAAIDGDGYNPSVRCGPGTPASAPVNESVNTGTDGNDKIIGGAGVENVRAGGGDDLATVKGNADLVCGESGVDTLFGDAEADQIWGGSDGDVIQGGTGADHLYGNGGNDTIYGNADADQIEGNADTDWITGGDADDVIVGGTLEDPGHGDDVDYLFGDLGNDTIIGDNGTASGPDRGPDSGDWYPVDLATAPAAAGGGDFIWGASGIDTIFGGLENDTVFGGVHSDYIEGNNATDTVYGQDGADDIIGGSSQFATAETGLHAVGRPDADDHLFGGAGEDVIAGDNAIVAKVTVGTGHLASRDLQATERSVQLLDLGYTPAGGTSGGDEIEGDDANDVIFGQGGIDTIGGGDGDDHIEGGQAGDTIDGDMGHDDIMGGSSTIESGTVAAQTAAGQKDDGDTVDGGPGADVVIGDNGFVYRATPPGLVSPLTTNRGITERVIELYDLGASPTLGTSGGDDVVGSQAVDIILGQDGNDRLKGNSGDDYVEGGPGQDWVEGNENDDDLVGGSSTIDGADTGLSAAGQPDGADVVWGGDDDDIVTGDNAIVTRNEPFDPRTYRIGNDGEIATRRSLRLLDLQNGGSILTAPLNTRFGGDQLSGGDDVDVMFGQDGPDEISGGFGDDYAEGNGAGDYLWGDQSLSAAGVTQLEPPVSAPWPGTASSADGLNGPDGLDGVDGQDDLLGGSTMVGFRDAGDLIHGDGASDFELGDNGTVRRLPIDPEPDGTFVDTPYAKRYHTVTSSSAALRVPAEGQVSTRFCAVHVTTTCEVSGAFGGDTMFGDGGDDFLYGQDGNDVMHGGAQDDDMYGELGDDTMFGDDGDDAMLGDRGGIVDQYEDGGRQVDLAYNQVPQIEYHGFLEGDVTRIVDLQHDVIGDHLVDNAGVEIEAEQVPPAKMPYDGVAFGGNDRMRGGNGADSLHGGVGDDLINGDSGGDNVFGDDGADVLWGGKGCDAAVDFAGPRRTATRAASSIPTPGATTTGWSTTSCRWQGRCQRSLGRSGQRRAGIRHHRLAAAGHLCKVRLGALAGHVREQEEPGHQRPL